MVLKRKQVYCITRETKVIIRRTSLVQDTQVGREENTLEVVLERTKMLCGLNGVVHKERQKEGGNSKKRATTRQHRKLWVQKGGTK